MAFYPRFAFPSRPICMIRTVLCCFPAKSGCIRFALWPRNQAVQFRPKRDEIRLDAFLLFYPFTFMNIRNHPDQQMLCLRLVLLVHIRKEEGTQTAHRKGNKKSSKQRFPLFLLHEKGPLGQ